MTDDIFDHLSASLTDGLLCPALNSLSCVFTKLSTRFIPYFLSPHLTHLTIRVHLFHYLRYPRDLLPDPAPILRILPTPCLQELSLGVDADRLHHLKDEFDSMVKRCGHFLRVLDVPAPLGEAAVHHVMGLRNLRAWDHVCSPPPATLPLSANFPPLQTLFLSRRDAYRWILWLARRETEIFGAHDRSIENVGLKKTLTRLGFHDPVPIDAAFISPLSRFSNLIVLHVRSHCSEASGCVFSLTNQNVAQLSVGLPRLELLELGRVCAINTCPTTVACFLALSVHCGRLHTLRTHWSTTNLISDIRSLSEDPDFRDLSGSPARCALTNLHTGSLPFPQDASDEDVTALAMGLLKIFPCLLRVFSRSEPGWNVLDLRVRELQRVGSPTSRPPEPPQV